MKKRNMKILFFGVAAVVAIAAAVGICLSHTRTLHVSPAGPEDGDGSKERPFRTVTAALAVAKKGDRVELQSGIYRECVEVSTDGITLCSAKDAEVTVTGLDPLSLDFTLWRDGIYVSSCPDPVECLFDGNRELLVARWPNAEAGELLSMPRATCGFGSDREQICSDLPTDDLTGARVVVWPGAGYTAVSRRITASDGLSFRVDRPMTAGNDAPEGYDTFAPVQGNAFYLCDCLSLLDAPGEWYYDSAEKKLYICPPVGKTPGECMLSRKVREVGLSLTGSGITVSGINLLACAARVEGNHCVLDSVNSRSGDYFLDSDMYDYSSHIGNCLVGKKNTWKNSEISHTWGSGLCLRGEKNVAERLYIHDIDFAGGYFGGVSVSGEKNEVVHCTIAHSGRYLIYYNGGGHTFRENDLSDASRITADCGAVYTWGNQNGEIRIVGNYVHDNPCAGIYVDNNCRDIRVEKNFSVNNRYGIIMNSQFLDCTVRQNLFYGNEALNSTYCYDADTPSMKGSIIENNRYAGEWVLISGDNAPTFRNNIEITEIPFDWEKEIPADVGCGWTTKP